MDTSKAPPLSLWLRELPYLTAILSGPLRRARGVKTAFTVNDPLPPVVVIPGIMSSDYATSLLRRTLAASGYRAHGSNLGFVTGVTPEKLAVAEARLAELHERYSDKIVLIGWSLGGIFARVLAQRHPDKVRMVVTLASPFSGNRRANNAWRLYNLLNDHTVDAPSLPDDPSLKPPVHTVAVCSLIDGVIAPDCSWGKNGERDVAAYINARHFAFGSSRGAIEDVVNLVAEELAMRCPLNASPK